MGWAEIGLLILRIANTILNLVHNKQLMDAGTDRAIAKEAVAILANTQVGKEIYAKTMGMTEAEADAAFKELEPK